jgi:hypothetical protein
MPQRLPGASTYVKSLGGALAEICWFLVELAASLLNLPDLMVESISWIMAALRAPAHKLKRAQIRLATDAGANDEEIAVSVGVGGLDPLSDFSVAFCWATQCVETDSR